MAKQNSKIKKKKQDKTLARELSRPKAPLGQGKSARKDRKKKARIQQELQAQLGELHLAKKRRLKHEGVDSDKSTGFAKAFSPDTSKLSKEPIKRFFWGGPKATEEPDEALKLQRKRLGIKVRGSPIPAPVERLSDPLLPAAFGKFFQGERGRKMSKPTAIQMQVWPAALSGLDVMGIAPTGSGKTLSYLLPAAVHIAGQEKKHKDGQSPACLVLLPTRELASQVSDQCKGKGGLRQVLGLRAEAIYGGVAKQEQLDNLLSSGCPEVLAATPGRLLDLLGLAALNLEAVTFLVLDEADRMLALGFEEQLDAIAKGIRSDRQCLLFSATFPLRLQQAAERWLTSSEKVTVRVGTVDVGAQEGEQTQDVVDSTAGGSSGSTDRPVSSEAEERRRSGPSTLTVSSSIEQIVHVCAEHKKQRKLLRFLDKIRTEEKEKGVRQRALVIIFCNKIEKLKVVAGFLSKHGHPCSPLHSGIPQVKREQALSEFKAGQMQTLVATDVAARGLHVKHLRYVINYDFPSNLEQYCHRIGRTGRDGESGTAYSFFTRNLAVLSKDLVQLLERGQAKVDPNLRALAENKPTSEDKDDDAEADGGDDGTDERPHAAQEEEAEAAEAESASEEETGGVGAGGGLVIRPKKKRPASEDSDSGDDEVATANPLPAGQNDAKKHGGAREKSKKQANKNRVQRPRGRRGGAKHKR